MDIKKWIIPYLLLLLSRGILAIGFTIQNYNYKTDLLVMSILIFCTSLLIYKPVKKDDG